MKWSFPIARIFGTQLRIHLTFFLLLIWVGFAYWGNGGLSSALLGILFVLALFVCVILHEFGHALTARIYGIKTPDITLLPIGGLARLERMPRDPKQELLVALAGPAVNVVIATLLFLFLQVGSPFQSFSVELNSVRGFMVSLMVVNVWLVLFNLVPAFPMDGGRVLRAILATRLPYARATSVAAVVGQALAFVGGLLGFIIPSPILIFIAFFVFLAAGAEANFARTQEATEGVRVADAMMTRIEVLKENDPISRAIDLLLQGSQTDFPVLDSDGEITGMVLRNDLFSALRKLGEEGRVTEALSPCPGTVNSDSVLSEALQELYQRKCSSLPVVDSNNGQLVGLLSLENIGEMLMVKSALDDRRKHGFSGLADTRYEPGQSLINR